MLIVTSCEMNTYTRVIVLFEVVDYFELNVSGGGRRNLRQYESWMVEVPRGRRGVLGNFGKSSSGQKWHYEETD